MSDRFSEIHVVLATLEVNIALSNLEFSFQGSQDRLKLYRCSPHDKFTSVFKVFSTYDMPF